MKGREETCAQHHERERSREHDGAEIENRRCPSRVRQQKFTDGRGKRRTDARCRTGREERERRRFDDESAAEARTTHAERPPHGELALSSQRARNEHVRHVRNGDEK